VPMVLTAPGIATMVDQFLVLIVTTACWSVLATSFAFSLVAAAIRRLRIDPTSTAGPPSR
jgi:cation transporter-like permease